MSTTAAPSPNIELLEERLRRRERELAAIRRITNALHARTKLDDLIRQTLHAAIETVDASGGTVYLHNPKKSVLVFRYVVAATDEIAKRLQGLELPDTTGISGEVFHSGIGRITLAVSEEDSHNRDVDAKTDYVTENLITVPLRSTTGANLGVLQVLNRQLGTFDDEDLEVTEILASQAASAIETSRLYEEARRASIINLIGDISHDVKNLLTPVVTGTQTLEMLMDGMFQDMDAATAGLAPQEREAVNGAVAGVREFYHEAVSMAVEGADDAQSRVKEIADAIKGIIAEPHFEPGDLRERADSVAKVLHIVAVRKDVSIDTSGVQDLGPVEMDRKSIQNALYNLVNNAIPETPAGGHIYVRARAAERQGIPGAELQVADTGRGMPPEVRELMFTENAISTKPGGTGLGTRIVKNVVDLHHGTITVDSEAGKGTTFTIWLPVRQPRATG